MNNRILVLTAIIMFSPVLADKGNSQTSNLERIAQIVKMQGNDKLNNRISQLNALYDERRDFGQKLNQMMKATTNNQEKCTLAYIMGLNRLEWCADILVSNICLYNMNYLEPDSYRFAEGEYPAQSALREIGKPAIFALVNLLGTSANEKERKAAVDAIVVVIGPVKGRAVVTDAMEKQKDPDKKARLQEALSNEKLNEKK